jgi:hypothetical protein
LTQKNLKKIKDAQPEVLKRADAMTNNRDDRNINLDYTKKNAKDRAALDLAEQEAVRMHGSIIGNKLKARAQKNLGNPRKTGRIKTSSDCCS